MNWNWLGILLWIGSIAFICYVVHYIRVHQLMLVARDKKTFDGGLFARYVVLVIVAVLWFGTMAYMTFLRPVNYTNHDQVRIHTVYHQLNVGEAQNGYYYVVTKRSQNGKRPIVAYTYWTNHSRNTVNGRYSSVAAGSRLMTLDASGLPWNKKELAKKNAQYEHAFAAEMRFTYTNNIINGLGIRCGHSAGSYTLLRVPAHNMVYDKR